MKKRILFVSGSLRCGGAEKSLSSLLSVFDYSSYDVDLLLLDKKSIFFEIPREVNVLPEIKMLKYLAGSPFKIPSNPKYFIARINASLSAKNKKKWKGLRDNQRFWKSIEKQLDFLPGKYDAAVAWGQGEPTYFVAGQVIAQKKIAVMNSTYSQTTFNPGFDEEYYRKFDYIAAVSESCQRDLEVVFPSLQSRMLTLYDIRSKKVIERMGDEFVPFTKNPSELAIVTVGRLSKEKGQDLAIKAASVLRESNISFHWYFVGEGPLREELDFLISENDLSSFVTLCGSKSNPYPYMKFADVYVQPSRFEGRCGTIVEAKFFDVPIVVTDFMNDLTKDGINGVVTQMTGEALAKGIVRLISDEDLKNKIVQNLKSEEKGNEKEVDKLYSLFSND